MLMVVDYFLIKIYQKCLLEPFADMSDVQSRLIPFHCSTEPEITQADHDHAENEIMEPLCTALLDR